MGNRPGNCNSCPECVYLGEGDFACMAGEGPKIVMSDFSPTDDYEVCPKSNPPLIFYL